MSKKMKIALISAVGIGLILLFYFLSSGDDKKGKKKDEPTKELYKQVLNKDGLYFLKELLITSDNVNSLEIIPDPLDTSLKITDDSLPKVFLLIDRDINISPDAMDTLARFVEKGNHAFVSVNNFNSVFTERFSYYSITEYLKSDEISLSLSHDSLKTYEPYSLQKYHNNVPRYRNWNYFELNNFNFALNEIATLGIETFYDNPVFVRFKYGNGYFYLYSVPEVFFNESLFNEDGFEYAQRAFSNLPRGDYKWFSHLNIWNKFKDIDPYNPEITRESPLQHILGSKYLRLAYILLIVALLLFVLFAMKRKQAIIPTVEPNENSSLEFVETVSRLYLKQEKHYKFIKHYQQSFLHFIKDKYYLSSPKIDDDFVKSIALKSGIEIEKIKEIFHEFKRARKSHHYSANELIALHKKIEYFYKNCK